jgi:hypothetical protein
MLDISSTATIRKVTTENTFTVTNTSSQTEKNTVRVHCESFTPCRASHSCTITCVDVTTLHD